MRLNKNKAKQKENVLFGVTIETHNVIPSNTLTGCVTVHH
jgi:hypothetical protein